MGWDELYGLLQQVHDLSHGLYEWDDIVLQAVDDLRARCPGCTVGRQGKQMTPLWRAANNGHALTARALLEAKCEVAFIKHLELAVGHVRKCENH